uniref:Uncharacterized protein n=1 Tax=Nelumbo nucifera TaxID=4432 RepID=A0A822YPG4_NELNU|nr:TPA_asm: hypothetical protein HUJ06_011587 [Nelumbo nucifera]
MRKKEAMEEEEVGTVGVVRSDERSLSPQFNCCWFDLKEEESEYWITVWDF